MDLPKDLRLVVYERAFESNGRNIFLYCRREEIYKAPAWHYEFKNRLKPPHALFLVNSTIYNEAIRIFHQNTKFVMWYAFNPGPYYKSTRSRSLHKISAGRFWKYVKHLVIQARISEAGQAQALASLTHGMLAPLDDGGKLRHLTVRLLLDRGHPPGIQPPAVLEDVRLAEATFHEPQYRGRFAEFSLETVSSLAGLD